MSAVLWTVGVVVALNGVVTLVLLAYYAGEESAKKARDDDKHAEQAIRAVREWER